MRFRLLPPLPRRAGPPDPTAPVLFFVPARDEETTVAAVIERAPRHVAGREVVVVVVDDGSSDRTAETAKAAGAEVVPHGYGRGLGAAVRTGLELAAGRGVAAVAFCDADGEYDPAELPVLVEPILGGRADYVVGSRFAGRIDRMLPHRRVGNRMLSTCLRVVTRCPVSDGQSGFRALSGRAAARAEIVHDYNYAQVLTLDLLAKGFGYLEVPISYRFRTNGRSFVKLPRYLSAVVPAVWRELNDAPA